MEEKKKYVLRRVIVIPELEPFLVNQLKKVVDYLTLTHSLLRQIVILLRELQYKLDEELTLKPDEVSKKLDEITRMLNEVKTTIEGRGVKYRPLKRPRRSRRPQNLKRNDKITTSHH